MGLDRVVIDFEQPRERGNRAIGVVVDKLADATQVIGVDRLAGRLVLHPVSFVRSGTSPPTRHCRHRQQDQGNPHVRHRGWACSGDSKFRLQRF